MATMPDPELQFNTIEEAVNDFSELYEEVTGLCTSRRPGQMNGTSLPSLTRTGNGEFVIVLDSQDRENEGDLMIAADSITEAKMASMVHYTRYIYQLRQDYFPQS